MLFFWFLSFGGLRLVFSMSFCTCSQVSRSMIGSCTSLKIAQFSFGFSTRVLLRKDFDVLLKLIMSPQYAPPSYNYHLVHLDYDTAKSVCQRLRCTQTMTPYLKIEKFLQFFKNFCSFVKKSIKFYIHFPWSTPNQDFR